MSNGQPGLMLAERRVADVSRVSYYRAGSAGSALSAADAAACLADAPRILHLTGITPALSASAAEAVTEAVRLARRAGALVSVDVNYRAKLWTPEQARPVLSELVRSAHIVIASEDELGLVVSDPQDESAAAGELAAYGVNQLVIKRGARGATVWQEGVAHHAAAIPVPVLDTIGAGDAFTAGYLSGVLDGLPPAAALAPRHRHRRVRRRRRRRLGGAAHPRRPVPPRHRGGCHASLIERRAESPDTETPT